MAEVKDRFDKPTSPTEALETPTPECEIHPELLNPHNWVVTHTYGGDTLPEFGDLLPEPRGGLNEHVNLVSYVRQGYGGKEDFSISDTFSVYLTFGSVVPSIEMERLKNSKCVFIIPYLPISAQFISLNFAECIALGPVKIPPGSIIVCEENVIIPNYYLENNIRVVRYKELADRNNAVKEAIESEGKVTAEMEFSKDMQFSLFADLNLKTENVSLSMRKVNPLSFFKTQAEVFPISIGFDHDSFCGYAERIRDLHDNNVPGASNSFLNLFSFQFHTKVILNWLDRFPNLPDQSKKYFIDKLCCIFSSWSLLSNIKMKSFGAVENLVRKVFDEFQNQTKHLKTTEEFLNAFDAVVTKNANVNFNKDDFERDVFVILISDFYKINDIKEVENYISQMSQKIRYHFAETQILRQMINVESVLYSLYAMVQFSKKLGYDKNINNTDRTLAPRIQDKILIGMIHPEFNIFKIPRLLFLNFYMVIKAYINNPKYDDLTPHEFFNCFLKRIQDNHRSEMGSAIISTKKRIYPEDEFPKILQDLDKELLDLKSVQEKLSTMIRDGNLRGAEIIEQLCADSPTLKSLFEASAQVHEGYSIKTHTRMVFEMFQEQEASVNYQAVMKTLSRNYPNIRTLMRVAVALHDIGKSIGNKEKQHEHTLPILQKVLEFLNYSRNECVLAACLVGTDSIGEQLKKCIGVERDNAYIDLMFCDVLQNEIKKLKEPVTLSLYFYLKAVLYISDAGSYPDLFLTIMKEVSNQVFTYIPESSMFRMMAERCNCSLEMVRHQRSLTPYYQIVSQNLKPFLPFVDRDGSNLTKGGRPGEYEPIQTILDYC